MGWESAPILRVVQDDNSWPQTGCCISQHFCCDSIQLGDLTNRAFRLVDFPQLSVSFSVVSRIGDKT